MGSKFFKTHKHSYGIIAGRQLEEILNIFPDAKVVYKKWDSFEVILKICPNPISEQYEIKISYSGNKLVRVFVVNKKLEIAKNRAKLPHVYNSEEQQICLYSPSKKEWSSNQYLTKTIIPWASEWLYNYELWIPEGKWYGGGHDEYPNETNNKILKDE